MCWNNSVWYIVEWYLFEIMYFILGLKWGVGLCEWNSRWGSIQDNLKLREIIIHTRLLVYGYESFINTMNKYSTFFFFQKVHKIKQSITFTSSINNFLFRNYVLLYTCYNAQLDDKWVIIWTWIGFKVTIMIIEFCRMSLFGVKNFHLSCHLEEKSDFLSEICQKDRW